MENLQQSRNQVLRGGGKQPPRRVEKRAQKFVQCHHGVDIHQMTAPWKYAVAYVLYYKEGLDIQDLVRLFQRSRSTINNYLSNARTYLKRHRKFIKYEKELEEYLRTGWYRDIVT